MSGVRFALDHCEKGANLLLFYRVTAYGYFVLVAPRGLQQDRIVEVKNYADTGKTPRPFLTLLTYCA